MINGVSHLLSYWIEVQPLGQLLNAAIDGGVCLNKDFWHPLRPPMVHDPEAVARLVNDLSREWESIRESGASADDWLSSEMDRLLTVLTHASETGSCIVTALDLPGDTERAQRVRIPWRAFSATHGRKRPRWWKLW
jgi:hypothetical protein